MELALMTWPEVENYLKTNQTLLIPIGSTEQHGPTGLIGTDFLTANDVAKGVGEKTATLVAPPITYGMAHHHLAFPGSSAIKPSTMILLVKDIVEAFARHKFNRFCFVNGHGGNIPSLQAAFSEILDRDQHLHFELYNWWHMSSVTAYEKEAFGQENGFHATCGEISATMAKYPEAFKNQRNYDHFPTQERHAWPLSPGEFRETFPDGRMGSNPSLSTAAHGVKILSLAIDEISQALNRKKN